MAQPHPSREPLPCRSLAEVQQRVREVPGRSASRRSNLIWALNAVGKALRLPLDSVPADPQWLRQALERCGPAAAGLGTTAWANVRSGLGTSLDLAGVRIVPGRARYPLLPAWQALADRMPIRPHRAGLSPFMSYCSAEGILPWEVTAETFERFRASVEFRSLRSRPEAAYRDLRTVWNRCREEIEGFPDLELAIESRRRWYARPWSAFPATLEADVEAMIADATGTDVVTMKARRRIDPDSAKARAEAVRRIASGYVLRGGDPATLQTLRDLVEPAVVREGLRFMIERAGGEATRGVDGALGYVIAIARQWVEAPDELIEELVKMRKTLDVPRYGMQEETRILLRRFDDPALLKRLFEVPEDVIRKAASTNRLTESQAVAAAVALAVLLLLEAPVRIGNLASTDLEHHLRAVLTKHGRRYQLSYAAGEVKNREALHFPLSTELTELIDLYLERVRPRLLRRTHAFLFPGETEGAKGSSLLSSQIARFMADRIGVRMPAHRFRALVGYLYLKRHPGDWETVRRFLGHRDIATTVNYYVPLQQDEAIAAFEATIGEIRDEVRMAAPGRR